MKQSRFSGFLQQCTVPVCGVVIVDIACHEAEQVLRLPAA